MGVFQEKDIAKYIIWAVEPRELCERIEFEVSTEQSKQYARSLQMLYVVLVDKYTLWYTLFPVGVAARTPQRREGTRNMAFQEPAARGGCFTCSRVGHQARFCGQNREAVDRPTPRYRDNGRQQRGTQSLQGPRCLKCQGVGRAPVRDCRIQAPHDAAYAPRQQRDDGRSRFNSAAIYGRRAPLKRSERVGAATARSTVKKEPRRQWNKRVSFAAGEEPKDNQDSEVGVQNGTCTGPRCG